MKQIGSKFKGYLSLAGSYKKPLPYQNSGSLNFKKIQKSFHNKKTNWRPNSKNFSDKTVYLTKR